jgi:hypothetical protein
VRVRKIVEMHNQTILERELEYSRRIKETDQGGEIELFS